MPAQSTIIGIGEAMLAEFSGGSEPAGLALDIALASHRLGHVGIAVSRLGQDAIANELLTKLLAAELEVSHLQSDPDLPTGRLVVRTVAGVTRRNMQPRAAFDNLQWDFDLVDVAQSADAVVCGMFAQRGGQTQSVITRFLDECGSALRVFDLTNRGEEPADRRRAMATVERADMLIVDSESWKRLRLPGEPANRADVVSALMRHSHVVLVLCVEEGATAVLHTTDTSHTSQWTYDSSAHAPMTVGFIHALLRSNTGEQCLRLAGAALSHALAHPGEKLPENWAQGA